MKTDLVKLLDAIAGLNIIVIGESMLDCYLSGVADRLCPEAPVPVVNVTDQKYATGGAANTAVNVHSLGAKVTLLSVIGDDWEGALLRQVLQEHGVSWQQVLTHPGRRTLTKQRVIAAATLLVRFDQGSTHTLDLETEQALIDKIEQRFPECDAVIVSDYGYGILTPRVIQAIAKLQQSQPRILVVDSKQLSAYRHVGVTAVKPNYKQAIQLLGIPQLTEPSARINQIAAFQKQILDLTGARIAAVTLDAEGALIFEGDRSPHRTHARKVTHNHTSGAGDTFVSALTLALAAGAPTPDAADLAASAAAVVVGKEGTTPCSAQELQSIPPVPPSPHASRTPLPRQSAQRGETPARGWLLNGGGLGPPLGMGGDPRTALAPLPIPLSPDQQILDSTLLLARLASYRTWGYRIVFTNGCFDILHAGHVSYLNRAKALGDILIIGVNSDLSVSRLKGPSRPINPLSDRIQVLAALGCVDHLVAFDDDSPINLIQEVRPDIYVKGGDYTKQTLPEASLVEHLGGVVQILPFVENRSTTSMIERICKAQLEEETNRRSGKHDNR